MKIEKIVYIRSHKYHAHCDECGSKTNETIEIEYKHQSQDCEYQPSELCKGCVKQLIETLQKVVDK